MDGANVCVSVRRLRAHAAIVFGHEWALDNFGQRATGSWTTSKTARRQKIVGGKGRSGAPVLRHYSRGDRILYGRLDLANANFADASSRERELRSVDPRDAARSGAPALAATETAAKQITRLENARPWTGYIF